jgi:peptidyl-dipeptidase A
VQKSFESFLNEFVPKISSKEKQYLKLMWVLETTSNKDVADVVSSLGLEYKLMFSDKAIYENLLKYRSSSLIKDDLLKRQLDILIKSFKENMISKEILKKITDKETTISQIYNSFRPSVDGISLSENEIKNLLESSLDVKKRKKIWEVSKEIGNQLAPHILEVVKYRNEGARELGYDNYFQMQLDLQNVDGNWLFDILDDVYHKSEDSYKNLISQIQDYQIKKFNVDKDEIGPWLWSEPFSQEDPIDVLEINQLFSDIDMPAVVSSFYKKMGKDIEPILKRSDLYEKENKSQHAFCIDIDREGDVRTLNNLRPTIRWLDTLLHEMGHAIYDLGFDNNLPWLLKTYPHIFTTEAIALIMGRQAYNPNFIKEFIKVSSDKKDLIEKACQMQKRRQLIFSRWVLVMTYFEKSLYEDPSQNLNKLWWELVRKYQNIHLSQDRSNQNDWASKYHIGIAPVYYFSYLLGEFFASTITEVLKKSNIDNLWDIRAGQFLSEKIFHPGAKYTWETLVKKIDNKPLNCEAWIKEYVY